MLCVEWMAVHFVESISGCIGVAEFNKSISIRDSTLDGMRDK
jgi:hypothetical protein